MSFNKSTLIGNICDDLELKQTPSGIAVTNFTLAVARKYDRKQTDFIDIVAWRGTAEFICKHFSKGLPILVCGSIQTRSYTDGAGHKRKAFEIVADEVAFVGSRGERAQELPPEFEEIPISDDLPF